MARKTPAIRRYCPKPAAEKPIESRLHQQNVKAAFTPASGRDLGAEALRKTMSVFFCIVGWPMASVFASGPSVFVEKTATASLTSISVSASGLPEMRSIAFTCTYSVPHAAIMNAIVSSPQPKTALSVTVDTAASSLSIAVRAASTILIASGVPILTIKISGAPNQGWPLIVIKANVVDKQGLSSQVPVSLAGKLFQNSGPFKAYAEDRLTARTIGAGSVFFDAGGRTLSGLQQRYAAGFYLKTIDNLSGNSRFSIK